MRISRYFDHCMSLPMWERGLKQYNGMLLEVDLVSLPMWERGLKLVEPLVDGGLVGRSPCGSVD